MEFVWNDEMQEALGMICLLAHKNRVDITITFTHDGDVEVKAEPTYWDRDTTDTPQSVENNGDIIVRSNLEPFRVADTPQNERSE